MIIEFAMPHAGLSPNNKNGRNYHAYRAAKDKAKAEAKIMTITAMALQARPAATPIALHIAFIHPTRHNRDLDNSVASCKAHIDGMSAALGIDDGCFMMMMLTKEYQKGVSKMIFNVLWDIEALIMLVIKREKKNAGWSTDSEIEYINRLGVFEQDEDEKFNLGSKARSTFLKSYIATIPGRVRWANVDRKLVTKHAKALLLEESNGN